MPKDHLLVHRSQVRRDPVEPPPHEPDHRGVVPRIRPDAERAHAVLLQHGLHLGHAQREAVGEDGAVKARLGGVHPAELRGAELPAADAVDKVGEAAGFALDADAGLADPGAGGHPVVSRGQVRGVFRRGGR